MKISKATVKRINKAEIGSTLNIIGEILCRSAVILGEPGHYEANDGDPYLTPFVYSDGSQEFVSSYTSCEYEKRVVRGLSTLYPMWISGTFTHGLNGVNIYEVNKLVRAIAAAP